MRHELDDRKIRSRRSELKRIKKPALQFKLAYSQIEGLIVPSINY